MKPARPTVSSRRWRLSPPSSGPDSPVLRTGVKQVLDLIAAAGRTCTFSPMGFSLPQTKQSREPGWRLNLYVAGHGGDLATQDLL